MALMRYYVDTRIVGSIASRFVATFAHGLPGIPNVCNAQFAVASGSQANWLGGIACLYDISNVSIYNSGDRDSGDLQVTTMLFHSIIQ